MKNLTVIKYYVFKENNEIKSFKYLSKAKRFAISNNADYINKEIIKNRYRYSSSKLIPYFIEFFKY